MRTHSTHTPRTSSHSAAPDTSPKLRSIRVALYVRVSTDKQAEFGMSLDAQKAELERYCRDRNWTVAGLYIDGGFSGKNTARPVSHSRTMHSGGRARKQARQRAARVFAPC